MPECFLVSSSCGNPVRIEGTDVRTVEASGLDIEDTLVIIAVTELLQDEVCVVLEKHGFRHFLRIGAHEEHLLMSAYFDGVGRFSLLQGGREDRKGQNPEITVYEVKNHRDKPLRNPPKLSDWEIPIQAGAALTDERIAPLADDTGDNISAKNRQYSELTATYWVWRNTTHAWKGICHYRRHFVISPEQMSTLGNGSIDALLPLPYVCYPNTLSQFGRFVGEAVQEALRSSLRTLDPSRYDAYLSLLNGKYQYTYNLVCARGEVFDAYCAWFFPILAHMEQAADTAPEIASTRALSYAAEVLTSLYFLSREETLNIRHVEKRIIV
jgi:hypothetical protein